MSSDNYNDKIKIINDLARSVEKTAKEADASKRDAERYLKEFKDYADAIAKVSSIKIEDEAKGKKGKHINEYLEDFYFFTGKTSEINRNLALAGFAIIWIFKYTKADAINHTITIPLIPHELHFPLLFLVISLSLDLLHYILAGIIWGTFYRVNLCKWESGKIIDKQAANLESPNILTYTINTIFFLKIIAMLIAYVMLLIFISNKIY